MRRHQSSTPGFSGFAFPLTLQDCRKIVASLSQDCRKAVVSWGACTEETLETPSFSVKHSTLARPVLSRLGRTWSHLVLLGRMKDAVKIATMNCAASQSGACQ